MEEEWIEAIVEGADADLANAVAEIRQRPPHDRGRSGLLDGLGPALSANSLLSKRTQAARYKLVLKALRPTDEEFHRLTAAAPRLPPHLRVTLAEVAPARLQHQVYGAPKTPDVDTVPGSRASSSSWTEDEAPTDRSQQSRPLRESTPSGGSEPDRRPLFVLASHADYQEPNRSFLEKRLDVLVLTAEDPESLDRLLRADAPICGFALDESMLRSLPDEGQRALLTALAEYSTFAPIRVHDTALVLGQDEVKRIIKECRRLRTPVPLEALSFEPQRTIRGAELPRYRLAADHLRRSPRAFFVFEDLSESEARLLAAAVSSRADDERTGADPVPSEARVRILPGGLSGARLLTVSAARCPTIVAKVTTKEKAREEVQRFRTFVRQGELHLNPQCYYHGEAGVILSSLVSDGEDSTRVAQSLGDVLGDLWNRECFGEEAESLDEDARLVALAVRNAARKLAELNRQDPPTVDDLNAFVDAPGTHLNDLEQRGIDFGMGELDVRALQRSAERRRAFPRRAIVHGDVHLQNVLRRGTTEAQWIDFASTTLGHPAIDLVRFELALCLGPMRQFDDFSGCIDFQRLFTIERAPVEVLMERCPAHFSCRVNRACIAGMIEARDQVIGVLRVYDGDPRDYWATKLVVAWQHLALIGSNAGMARAIVTAISEEMVKEEGTGSFPKVAEPT